MADELPYNGYKTDVNAPLELVWSVMVDKVKHPDKYLPGVKTVKIIEEGTGPEGQWVHRQMVAASLPMDELITWSEKDLLVTFATLNSPYFEGAIYNKVHVSDAGQISLEYYSTHKEKNPGPDSKPVFRNFDKAVLHTKQVIEDLHAKGIKSVL